MSYNLEVRMVAVLNNEKKWWLQEYFSENIWMMSQEICPVLNYILCATHSQGFLNLLFSYRP